MSTLIDTRPQQARSSTPTQPEAKLDVGLFLLRSIAIGALLTTALAISVTGAIDLCSSSGPITMMVAWFVLPTIAIASITGVATTMHRSPDRYLTTAVAITLTALWLYGLTWAHVADAINQTAC